MPAGVDIIVRSFDSTEVKLVVETKLTVQNLKAAEEQLKSSMLHLSCPVGLIITPQKMWVYADRFTSTDGTSIQAAGEFAISHLLRYKPAGSERATEEGRRFENIVQQWLEALPRTATREYVGDRRLWEALSKHVLPAIETGEVRAAAPRL
ncbi:MAG TPA: hypothetical protein VMD76_09855 [Candidatus Sulfotelmatobacter sp.]|nr:hypothetical protein [Candidatus Sulfotelmatobacter sp.]